MQLLPGVSWFLFAAPWPSGSLEAKASGKGHQDLVTIGINSHYHSGKFLGFSLFKGYRAIVDVLVAGFWHFSACTFLETLKISIIPIDFG